MGKPDSKPRVRHLRFTPSEGDGRTLVGLAVPFDLPTRIDSPWEGRFDEQFRRGAFKRSLGLRTPKLQFDHGTHSLFGSLPIGTFRSIKETSRGLEVEAEVFEADLFAPLREAIASEAIDGMSIRFRPLEVEITDPDARTDGGDVELRTVTEAALMELGPVVFPAYDNTQVDLRSFDLEDKNERRRLAQVLLRVDANAGLGSGQDQAPAQVTEPPATDSGQDSRHPVEPSQPIIISRSDNTMDIAKLESRWRSLQAEAQTLTTPPDDFDKPDEWVMPDTDKARFDEVEAEMTAVEAQIETIKRQKAVIARTQAFEPGDSVRTEPGFNVGMNRDPYDMSTLNIDAELGDLRARVETGLERDKVTPDDVKEGAVTTLRKVYGDKKGVARRYLATGSATYRSAFAKYIAGNQNLWTDKERQMVARAQSLTDAAGGFAVPFTLDPSIIGIDGLSFNPIRRIARVVQITTDSWNGVTGTSVSFSWDAEAAQVSDDSITLAQPSIPVHKLAGFVPFSVEVGSDWADIDSDLRVALMEGRDNAEATAHIKGTGTGQPTGIEVALDGTASEIAPATAEAFAASDVYNLQRLLPPRHRQQSPTWVMNIGTANDIRQFDTGGGGNFWTSLAPGAPETLLGYQWEESSVADDSPDINPAASEDNFILYIGNWTRYVLVDRVGMNVELVPHLFGANQRPTGQRGLYAYMRHGADSVDDNAFRVLSIPTTV